MRSLLLLSLALCGCGTVALAKAPATPKAPDPPKALAPPKAIRFPENPIITPSTSPTLGENINGPSLIIAPAWLKERLGKYYLYFADHRGKFIRLAYADQLAGPWKIYEPGTLRMEETRCVRHLASPDIHVDDARREIRMYFHCPIEGEKGQKSLLAVSSDGLHFTAGTEILGASYFRVFEWQGFHYAISEGGRIYRSRDGLTGFEAGPELFPKWEQYSVRHVAVKLVGDTLSIFYTRRGDSPERVMWSPMKFGGRLCDMASAGRRHDPSARARVGRHRRAGRAVPQGRGAGPCAAAARSRHLHRGRSHLSLVFDRRGERPRDRRASLIYALPIDPEYLKEEIFEPIERAVRKGAKRSGPGGASSELALPRGRVPPREREDDPQAGLFAGDRRRLRRPGADRVGAAASAREVALVAEEDAEALRDNPLLRGRILEYVRRFIPSLGENELSELLSRGGHAGGSGRFWTLDPIDGTKGFLRGEQYAIALALIDGGAVRLGVLGCPNLPVRGRRAGLSGDRRRGKGSDACGGWRTTASSGRSG